MLSVYVLFNACCKHLFLNLVNFKTLRIISVSFLNKTIYYKSFFLINITCQQTLQVDIVYNSRFLFIKTIFNFVLKISQVLHNLKLFTKHKQQIIYITLILFTKQTKLPTICATQLKGSSPVTHELFCANFYLQSRRNDTF